MHRASLRKLASDGGFIDSYCGADDPGAPESRIDDLAFSDPPADTYAGTYGQVFCRLFQPSSAFDGRFALPASAHRRQ